MIILPKLKYKQELILHFLQIFYKVLKKNNEYLMVRSIIHRHHVIFDLYFDKTFGEIFVIDFSNRWKILSCKLKNNAHDEIYVKNDKDKLISISNIEEKTLEMMLSSLLKIVPEMLEFCQGQNNHAKVLTNFIEPKNRKKIRQLADQCDFLQKLESILLQHYAEEFTNESFALKVSDEWSILYTLKSENNHSNILFAQNGVEFLPKDMSQDTLRKICDSLENKFQLIQQLELFLSHFYQAFSSGKGFKDIVVKISDKYTILYQPKSHIKPHNYSYNILLAYNGNETLPKNLPKNILEEVYGLLIKKISVLLKENQVIKSNSNHFFSQPTEQAFHSALTIPHKI